MTKIVRLMVVTAALLWLCCVDRAFAQSSSGTPSRDLTVQIKPGSTPTVGWPMFGQNIANTASNLSEFDISSKNVNQLRPKWTFTTGGDVSARAAVVNGVAYFPDWQGNLYAVDASTGKQIWSHQLSDYSSSTGIISQGTVSRTSPAVVNGVVYIGTQYVSSGPTGWLLAIDAKTGNLNWKIQPDTSNSFPLITASPVVANGTVYVGMTSPQESGLQCCSARGSVVAVNATRGAILWQTFTVPPGYSGAAVWGSNPVVDEVRGTVYVGTPHRDAVTHRLLASEALLAAFVLPDPSTLARVLPATGRSRTEFRRTFVVALRPWQSGHDVAVAGDPHADFGQLLAQAEGATESLTKMAALLSRPALAQ